jgi:DNA-binding beta-propeller fold protein YncE
MPHGIAILDGGNAAVADASKNQVVLFNEKSGRILATVATGEPPKADDWKSPDVMMREPKTGLLVASNHDIGELALIDPKLHKEVGKVKIGGELEDVVARGDGKLFVNVEDKGTIAVVDLPMRQVAKMFPMKGCEEPTGLAYDAPNDMIVSACANGVAKFLDATQGTELASLNVGKGADGVIYDPGRKTIFIPGGDDGKLSIIRFTDRHDIKLIQTIAIPLGTRLGAIDVNTGKVYLPNALPDMKAPPLRLPGLPPIPPAAKGSFEYLVVAPRSQ